VAKANATMGGEIFIALTFVKRNAAVKSNAAM
jgi:hypothetical protein